MQASHAYQQLNVMPSENGVWGLTYMPDYIRLLIQAIQEWGFGAEFHAPQTYQELVEMAPLVAESLQNSPRSEMARLFRTLAEAEIEMLYIRSDAASLGVPVTPEFNRSAFLICLERSLRAVV